MLQGQALANSAHDHAAKTAGIVNGGTGGDSQSILTDVQPQGVVHSAGNGGEGGVDCQLTGGCSPGVLGIIGVDHDLDLVTGGNFDGAGVHNGIAVRPLGVAIDVRGHVVDHIGPTHVGRHLDAQSAGFLCGPSVVVALAALSNGGIVVAQLQSSGILHGAQRIVHGQSAGQLGFTGVGDHEGAGFPHTGLDTGDLLSLSGQGVGGAVVLQGQALANSAHDHAAKTTCVVQGSAGRNSQDILTDVQPDGVGLMASVVSKGAVPGDVSSGAGSNLDQDDVALGHCHGVGTGSAGGLVGQSHSSGDGLFLGGGSDDLGLVVINNSSGDALDGSAHSALADSGVGIVIAVGITGCQGQGIRTQVSQNLRIVHAADGFHVGRQLVLGGLSGKYIRNHGQDHGECYHQR